MKKEKMSLLVYVVFAVIIGAISFYLNRGLYGLILMIFVLLLNVLFTGCEMKSSEKGNITHVGFIQNAINSASNGDIVNIPNGTYFENIVIMFQSELLKK